MLHKARPLLEFVQNFGFAHLLKEYAANAPRLKVGFIIAYLEWVSKHARFMTKSEENLKKSVDSGFEICYNYLRQRHKFIGELCNGSTYDSDSYCLGSNPSSPAICLHGQAVKTLPSQGKIMGSIPIGGAKRPIAFAIGFFFPPNRAKPKIPRKTRARRARSRAARLIFWRENAIINFARRGEKTSIRKHSEARPMGYIAGIGGANMDIHGRSDRQLIMRDSNPGSLHTSLGGVCRNICENLARLGENVRLITVVGDDVQGRGIVEGCEKAGIDMSAARVLRGERSSSYISIMDGDGDMLLAMSDMHIIKQLNAKLVDESRDLLCGADLVVCDGNLSAQTIERLAQVCDKPLYLDPVSTAWARELKPFIGCFDTVKPNRMELEVLSGCPVDTKENIVLACDILRGKGVRRVFVSLGRDGMYYRGPEGGIWGVSRPFDGMVNATGAGDASMAGIIYATRQGYAADEILAFGMGAGMVAIASSDTISREMSPAAIETMVKEYIK